MGLKTAREVLEYHESAQVKVDGSDILGLLPTVLINEETMFETIDECVENNIFDGKIYPLDRTTKSHNGSRYYQRLLPLVKHCGERGMRVHVHPEHPWMVFDNRDAEFSFLPIMDMFLNDTGAKLFWEHGSDARCIPFWKEMAESGRFFVGLTAHHLAADEDSTFGDSRATCKPPIKTRRDRLDFVRLVSEDHPWVIAGLDDAPHDKSKKQVATGRCACGAYTAPFGLQLYAHALDHLLHQLGGEEIFRNFTSRNARRIFGYPQVSRKVRLARKPYRIPQIYQVGDWTVEPFWAGQEILYSLVR
ncbi:MAG: hypothetical protein AAB641_02410 [Patescibacteria group bacterium]